MNAVCSKGDVACFTGKGADGKPAKWRWLPVKQSGSKPSPRCSMSAVVAPGNHGVMFGGVYDEVNGFEVWVLFSLIGQTWLRSASQILNRTDIDTYTHHKNWMISVSEIIYMYTRMYACVVDCDVQDVYCCRLIWLHFAAVGCDRFVTGVDCGCRCQCGDCYGLLLSVGRYWPWDDCGCWGLRVLLTGWRWCVWSWQEEDEEQLEGTFFNDMYTLDLDKGHWFPVQLRSVVSVCVLVSICACLCVCYWCILSVKQYVYVHIYVQMSMPWYVLILCITVMSVDYFNSCLQT